MYKKTKTDIFLVFPPLRSAIRLGANTHFMVYKLPGTRYFQLWF